MPRGQWWRSEEPGQPDIRRTLPPGVDVFEASHLFLLHAVLTYQRTMNSIGWSPRVLMFRLARVPRLDHRGARVITQLAQRCREQHVSLILTEVRPEAWRQLGREGVLDDVGPGNVFAEWTPGLERARAILRLD